MKTYCVFVYGSLMHPEDLSELFGDTATYQTAILWDYVRDFSKLSRSWGEEGENVGVLGIQECPGECVNGIIIKNVTEHQLNEYYKRETGFSVQDYDRSKSGYSIQSINPEFFDIDVTCSVLTSVINERLEEPNTNPEYKDHCYTAAEHHGKSFYENFCETTYNYFNFK